ncbi:MAG: Maf family protein [Bacillota bacterium]|nr:septum formation inhibitor Maf [Bacillota bacterium]HWR55831.1 Maf family protein [Negativicutes bacterium]
MSRIILASASPRRRELLAQIGLKCEVVPSDVVEEAQALAPEELAEHLAVLKAQDVAGSFTGEGYVIGADTLVVLDGVIYGKPVDRKDARRMLLHLQGREHQVITGLAVIRLEDGKLLRGHEITRVSIRPLNIGEIEAYIATGEPMDKAGAYAVQGRAAMFIPRINGCYFNVVGLPLARLMDMLNAAGWSAGHA